ncbi:MAG: MATE family efflux transporter [Henriciella sp.]|uniref:MATE family efflux transporter n=1 Tax=Henriciella sp. TaxID=1968823 RepID=UPI0032EB3060
MGHTQQNGFLTRSPARLFAENAIPMVFIMMMNGLLNVVDAIFLGHYVGTDAMAAVSIAFPFIMATIAFSTLVSGGMSSLLARHLGAGDVEAASRLFARAHGLALAVALIAIAAYLAFGRAVVVQASGGDEVIARMGHVYLMIMFVGLPVQFMLGVHGDACRNEGRAGLMALLSVGVTLGNAGLNFVLIVVLGWGVAGSAVGTVAAQGLAAALLVGIRLRAGGPVPLAALRRYRWTGGWKPILTLGAPLSLSFIGMALVSSVVIATLRLTAGETYPTLLAAYGIVTRIFGFTYLPLMAIGLATQAIAGNNVGAGLVRRSNETLLIAVGTAFIYGLTVESVLLMGGHWLGAGFVGDDAVIAAVASILRPMAALYLFTGPVLVVALYFQAVGQPGRTALLTLVKPFLLLPALIAAVAGVFGGDALWFAFPAADLVMAGLAGAIVIGALKARPVGGGFGLAAGAG